MHTTDDDTLGPDIKPLTALFRALGDETRLRMVALLSHGELCVCHLERALDLPQPSVSRQVGILRAAGVIEGRREGTWIYYQLAPQTQDAVERVLATLTATFGAERTIRTDHAKLRKSCGPDACR